MIGMTVVALDNKIKNRTSPAAAKQEENPKEDFIKLHVKKGNLDTKTITFDFPNTKLSVFARFVAKLCGKILIGEDQLKGNINIKSQRKMDLDEVNKLFRALLFSYGYEPVETENCIEIIHTSDSYVKVYKLENLKAADLSKSLSMMFRMSFRVGNNAISIQISPVEGSNALMVFAPRNQQVEIEQAIKKLDTRVRQVLLDVLVIELTTGDDFGYGAEATYSGNGFENSGIKSGQLTKNNAIGITYGNANWNIAVNAGLTKTKLKILSQPRVIAIENQKSQIKIENKEPFANGSTSQTNTTGSPSTTTTTSTEQVGIDLSVTPRINFTKDVTLELKLKFTSILSSIGMSVGVASNGSTVTNQVPIIGHRIINNTAIVKNGKTLILGGMLNNRKTLTTTAPPVLGDIPWVGFMFSKTTEVTEQTELMIFITPTVIENVEQLRALTKHETQKLQNYDPKEKGRIDQMLTGKKTEADDTFKLFDYFSDEQYRKQQTFIPQPENM